MVDMDMSGVDSVETEMKSYADHEHINLSVSSNADSNTNPDSVFSVDPLAEELESNQVAELVYYRRNAVNSQGGFEFGLGFNVTSDDFVEQAASNQIEINVGDESGFSGGAIAIYEEPGIIDFFEAGTEQDDDQLITQSQFELPIKELYNSGPFVDSTDNLDIHLEANNATGGTQNAAVQVQMVYEIHEVAQGVPRFSDPRRLME